MPHALLPARPDARVLRGLATTGLAMLFLAGEVGAHAETRGTGADGAAKPYEQDAVTERDSERDGRDEDRKARDRDDDRRDSRGGDDRSDEDEGDADSSAADVTSDEARSDEVTAATTENRVPGTHVGVPDGTDLQTMGSSTAGLALHARESRTLDGQDIRGRVEASGEGVVLTIRNSRLRYSADDHSAVRARDGARIVFEDSEIDGMGEAGRSATMGQADLLRTWVHNMNEGPHLSSRQRIVNSRIDEFFQGPNPTMRSQSRNHVDGIQATGARDAVVLGTYIDATVTQGQYAGYKGNAAAQFGEDSGSTDVEFAWNYVAGGQVALAANGSGTTGADVRVHHNTYKGDWQFGSRLERDRAISRHWDVATNVYAPGHPKAGQPVSAVN